MKNFFRFLPLFLLPLALLGCQSGDTDEGIIIDENPQDRRIGVITSLGTVPTTSEGTHLLRLDDGETILLKSLAVNLDDEKYDDVGVEVRGVLTYTKGNKPLMEVMNIDILPDYVPADVEAPEWETYETSSFLIDYRNDFELDEDSDGVTFTKTIEPEDEEEAASTPEDLPEDVVSITVTPKDDETLADFLGLEGDSSSDLLAEGLTRSKVGVYGLDAYKRDADVLTFYVEGESNFYTFRFEASDHPDARKNENLFYEMLNSFELTEGVAAAREDEDPLSDDLESRTLEVSESMEDDLTDDEMEEVVLAPVEGYETYESETFDFSLQYPKSWYFEGSAQAGTIRHYGFGTEPFDEGGEEVVSVDLVSTGAAAGEGMTVNGKRITKVQDGGTVEFYYSGESRIYKVTGPASQEDVLLQIASSISEE